MTASENNEPGGFDVVWNFLPHLSWYQFWLTINISIVAVQSALWTIWPVFGLFIPVHYRCHNILDEYQTNLSYTDKQNLLSSPKNSKCEFFDINKSKFELCLSDLSFTDCANLLKAGTNASTCDSYVFNDDEILIDGIYSVGMQYHLLCDREILSTVILVLTMSSFFLGATVSGILSDKYGRIKTSIVSLLILNILGIIIRFMPNWWSFTIVWLFMSEMNYVAFNPAAVYIVEILGPTKRQYAQILSVLFAVGCVLASLYAYWFPDWRNLCSFTAGTCLLSLPVLLLLPRSPDWLCATSNFEECWKTIQQFGRRTNHNVPSDLFQKLKSIQSTENPKEETSCFHAIRSPNFCKLSIIMGYNFIATSMIYSGLSYNAAALPGNLFINNALNGLVEVLAYILLIYVMYYVGRRTLTSGMFIFGGIVCVACGVLLQFAGDKKVMIISSQWLSFLAKFLVSGSYGIIYIYVVEIYPTTVRTFGTGLSSLGARIGGAAAPFIILLQKQSVWIPNVTYGIVSLIAGFTTLLLPETWSRPISSESKETENENKKHHCSKTAL